MRVANPWWREYFPIAMALADRTYMRDSYHPPRYTTVLIVTLIIAFVIQSLFFFYGGINSYPFLGLTVSGLGDGRVWQLFTFQFLHACPWPWHVLFNCLGLYFFGRTVEETLGSKRFLLVYFSSGFAGGLLQVLATLVLPKHPDVPVVGASAGVCGLIGVFCSLYPMRELTTWIYFFPVTIRARYFLLFIGGLSLFGTIVPFDSVAHGAHLGGILLGIAYVRWCYESDWFPILWRRLIGPRRSRPIVKVRFPGDAPWKRAKPSPAADAVPADFISREVDPILEKISAHGIHSLTERERKILEAARERMERK
jgi:membrane associated rhomboid family serine protease